MTWDLDPNSELAKALDQTISDIQRLFPSFRMSQMFTRNYALAALDHENPQQVLAENLATVSVAGHQRSLSDGERAVLINQRAAVLIESGWARAKVENAANEM